MLLKTYMFRDFQQRVSYDICLAFLPHFKKVQQMYLPRPCKTGLERSSWERYINNFCPLRPNSTSINFQFPVSPFPPCNSKIGNITNFAKERTPFSATFPSSQNAWKQQICVACNFFCQTGILNQASLIWLNNKVVMCRTHHLECSNAPEYPRCRRQYVVTLPWQPSSSQHQEYLRYQSSNPARSLSSIKQNIISTMLIDEEIHVVACLYMWCPCVKWIERFMSL